jgi:hypothetical protein
MSKIIVSGCSYTEKQTWPSVLFPDQTILNLGRSGAGNRYIADSITTSIVLEKPESVFVLWSGINRVDTIVPVHKQTDILVNEYHGKLNDAYYYFSGGDNFKQVIQDNYQNIKADHWPSITTIDDFLELPKAIQQECIEQDLFEIDANTVVGKLQLYNMLQYLSNHKYLENLTYQSILLCQSLLEQYDINYQFGFIYNPFDSGNQTQFGTLSKQNPMYGCITWDNYVTITPYEFGIKHNLLSDDNFHLTKDGMNCWAEEIKKYF